MGNGGEREEFGGVWRGMGRGLEKKGGVGLGCGVLLVKY